MRKVWFEDDYEIRLLRRGKRRLLDIVFGRTMVIVVLLLLQVAIMAFGAHYLGRYYPALSGILLAVLSFALFKFRLPENQVNVAVCAVYVISCFFGGILAGKTMRTRRFFWGLVLGTLYFLFLYLMSLAQKDGVTEDTKRLLSVLAMCTLSGMAGGMVS